MRNLGILMTSVLVLYLLSACAVQKRKYMRGYYFSAVTKTHAVRPVKTSLHVITTGISQKETTQTIVVPPANITTSEQVLAQVDAEPKIVGFKKEKKASLQLSPKKFKPLTDLKHVDKFQKKSAQTRPKILARIGFLLSVLAIFLILAGVALILLGAGPTVLLVGLGADALAFILCLIAIIKKIMDPLSRGTWMAILGIIISAATLYLGYLSTQI